MLFVQQKQQKQNPILIDYILLTLRSDWSFFDYNFFSAHDWCRKWPNKNSEKRAKVVMNITFSLIATKKIMQKKKTLCWHINIQNSSSNFDSYSIYLPKYCNIRLYFKSYIIRGWKLLICMCYICNCQKKMKTCTIQIPNPLSIKRKNQTKYTVLLYRKHAIV